MLNSRRSRNIFLGIFFLSGLGLVQVYSSSYIFALENYNSGLYFFKKQLLFTLVGFICFFVLCYIPWNYNRYLGAILWFCSVVALILTLIPKIGVSVSGASRWLQLPFSFRLQPSEFFKVTTPFAIAYMGVLKSYWPLQKPLFWVIPFFCLGFPLFVFSLQPDFGSLALILILCFSVLFILGLKWRYVFAFFIVLTGIAYGLIASRSYRLDRVETFLNPWQDPFGKGFQVIQSLLGVHSGGLFGTGIGKGQSKLFFLPEAHTDFTLAVLAEETGFLGLFIVLSVYGFLIFNGFQLVLKISDFYQKTIAFGLIMVFFLGFFIHCAVNLGLIPTKGLALPFLSYGGSALVSVFLLFGWLLSLEKNNRF